MSNLLNVIAHFETTIVDTIDSTSVSMELESVSTPAGDIPAGTYGFTLEEESSARREYVVGVVSGSTVTFSSRDISPLNATTVDSSSDSARQKHRKGTSVKLTNYPALQRVIRALGGIDSLDSSTPLKYDATFTPSADEMIPTKAWILSVVTGGTITHDQQVIAGVAGETIAAEDYIYLKEADGKWYLVDAATVATLDGVQKGIAQGAGIINGGISSGVLLGGLDKQISYTAGQLYYAQDGGGALGTSAGTVEFIAGLGDENNNLVIVPQEYMLTKSEKDAISGGSTFGTPSSANKFITEEKQTLDLNNAIGFGDGSDGTVEITGTVTLTQDMQYENLTITGTLITDGYTIKVQNTLDGVGTIKHSVPTDGGDGAASAGGGSNEISGAGGGSGASGGSVLIYAAVWAGTFTIESVGGAGGDGSAGRIDGTGGAPAGGTAATQRGAGIYKGSAGQTGGAGNSLTTAAGGAGTAGAAADPTLQESGKAGGAGGIADGIAGGVGGAGGVATAPTISPLLHRFLLSGFFGIDSSGQLENVNAVAGSGGGGGGARDGTDNDAGGGGGGAGANGGDAIVVYKQKTWTGSATLTGGAGGAAAAGAGTDGFAGVAGTAGADGTLEEVNYNELM